MPCLLSSSLSPSLSPTTSTMTYLELTGQSQQTLRQGAAEILAYMADCGIMHFNKTADQITTAEIYLNYLRSKGAPASVEDDHLYYTQALLHHLGPQLYEQAQQTTEQ